MAATDLGIRTDWEMHSGNNRTIQFTVEDSAEAAVDVTGATFAFEVSKLDSSGSLPAPRGDAIFAKAGAIIDAVNGRVDVVLVGADTAALKGDHYYELEMVDSGGNVSTVSFGILTIHKDLVTPTT